MKVVAYTRVSTAGQAEDGISLEAQQARIALWAELNSYGEVVVFTDAGVSGSSMGKRPGLQEALKAVGKGDALVVYSLSRLARSTKDTLEISDQLMNKGADLVSLSERLDTTSASGKMIFRLMAVLGEFERDLTAERTKSALAHKKSQGERVGHIPFGFELAEDGKTLRECKEEKWILSEIKVLRSGGLSLREIASRLNDRGITNRGNTWNHVAVKRVAKL